MQELNFVCVSLGSMDSGVGLLQYVPVPFDCQSLREMLVQHTGLAVRSSIRLTQKNKAMVRGEHNDGNDLFRPTGPQIFSHPVELSPRAGWRHALYEKEGC